MAETHPISVVDAFAAEPLAGTAVGVVPDAGGLREAQMAAVARELGVGRTAFVSPSDAADRRLDAYRSDGGAAPLGAATVATHARLHERGVIDDGTHAVETDAGVREVTVGDGVAWTPVGAASVDRVEVAYDRVGAALGIDPAALRDVGDDIPAAVASVGTPALIVPVNFLEHLGGADPDDSALASLLDDHGAAGVYAVTFDALAPEATLHARWLAPAPNRPRDAPTVDAAGACGAYLHAVGAFDDTPDEMRFECGHYVDRPGVVRIRSDGDGSVAVGGRAVTALEGTVVVPAAGDDDIITA